MQNNMNQIDATKYVFLLENSTSINHITVFLTQPFPDGYGATVHYNAPPLPDFTLLGMYVCVCKNNSLDYRMRKPRRYSS
jgi:hypothetical protein